MNVAAACLSRDPNPVETEARQKPVEPPKQPPQLLRAADWKFGSSKQCHKYSKINSTPQFAQKLLEPQHILALQKGGPSTQQAVNTMVEGLPMRDHECKHMEALYNQDPLHGQATEKTKIFWMQSS